MKYRSEIDGLRALAVSSVVVFHFFPAALPSGYLGVDLFFVISGFLISGYILEESTAGSFSFRTFYMRRVRRILPAALAVLLATAAVAFFVLIGSDFARFLKSLLAALTFTSNIYFWRTGGYFGTEDSLKPLLHMWSLGVEEQFYLFFPLCMVVFLRVFRRPVARWMGVVATVLLAFAACVYAYRLGADNPAFFLTPFRAWQFGCGVLAAMAWRDFRSVHSAFTLSLAVLLIVAGLLIALPAAVPPGLLVTVGTAMFLCAGYVAVPGVATFFANQMVRKVGLVSFSLYLWHWPVLAFQRYVAIEELSVPAALFGIALTVVLSLLSYSFIEEPFRHRIRPRVTLGWVAGATVALGAASLAALTFNIRGQANLAADRISAAIDSIFRCDVGDLVQYGELRACQINKSARVDSHLALVGNSHAQMYAPAMRAMLEARHERGILININACLPTLAVNISTECLRLANQNFATYVRDANIHTFVISMTWYSSSWIRPDGSEVADPDRMVVARAAIDLVERLRASGRDVYLIGPIALPGYDLPSVLSRRITFSHLDGRMIESLLRSPRMPFDKQFGRSVAFLSAKLGDHLLQPSERLCDTQSRYFGDAGGSYFSDANHLGAYGAVSRIEPLFEAVPTS